MRCGTMTDVTNAISRARGKISVLRLARSSALPIDTIRSEGLWSHNSNAIVACSTRPVSKMIVSNIERLGCRPPVTGVIFSSLQGRSSNKKDRIESDLRLGLIVDQQGRQRTAAVAGRAGGAGRAVGRG